MSSTIYELTNSYMDLLYLLEDGEMDAEALRDTMEGIEGEIEIKAENYAKVMTELKARSEALTNESKRLAERAAAINNNVDRMKHALEMMMETTGKTKFKTNLFSFNIQNNPPSVDIAENANIPEVFLIEQPPKIDKKGILEALKAGKEVDGCTIKQGRSLRIR